MHNFTEQQKQFFRSLMKEIEEGNLPETFIVAQFGQHLSLRTNQGYFRLFDKVQESVFELYEAHGLVTRKPVYHNMSGPLLSTQQEHHMVTQVGTQCTITAEAYRAMKTDFQATDPLVAQHFTSDLTLRTLDPRLQERSLPVLSGGALDPKRWDSAVRSAALVLEERLRDIGGVTESGLTAVQVVNTVFGQQGRLGLKVPADREDYRSLYAGMAGLFRNPSAHNFVDPTPQEGAAIILFINLLLSKLEELR
jgi:hypothetical protein